MLPHALKDTLLRTLALVAGALCLCWPAFVSGYPFLYPDSMSYLSDGRHVAAQIFLHRLTGYTAMRSEFYSLGIFFVHWSASAWPIMLLQALLVAYVLWLVVRSIVPHRTVVSFLALTALLSALTSVSWYTCLVMPDILGALVYLALYLVVLARETLSRIETWIVAAIAWWGMASHASHLVLAGFVCAILGILWLGRWSGMRGRGRSLGFAASLVLAVVVSQLALHAYLYGEPSLNGKHPPYMMARIIADGPGKWYLQKHCPQAGWAICADVDRLPDSDDEFLWDEDGVWASASHDAQRKMLAEEMPLVVAAVREYPRAQLQRSAANFWAEFTEFGLWDFCPSDWVVSELDRVLPGTLENYQQTAQQKSRLPVIPFTLCLIWSVCVSTMLIVLLLPVMIWRRRTRLTGLAAVIAPIIFANALLTAVLSEPDSRYQSRIIWLVPLLAGLMLLDLTRHQAWLGRAARVIE